MAREREPDAHCSCGEPMFEMDDGYGAWVPDSCSPCARKRLQETFERNREEMASLPAWMRKGFGL